VNVKIYVEGGGHQNSRLSTECRKGFRLLLEKAGMRGQMPRIVACGGRKEAYDDFCTAVRARRSNELLFLLVDSEGPVDPRDSAWAHLKKQGAWIAPAGISDEAVHLMVQCMEAWLVADQTALSAYFGPGFQLSALPKSPNIESIPKRDLLAALDDATRTTRKGRYRKGEHSFAILALIDPAKLKLASERASRFFESLGV